MLVHNLSIGNYYVNMLLWKGVTAMEPKLIESLWNVCEKKFKGIITNMAMAMDISQPTLTRILKGQTKSPDAKTMEAIYKITGWEDTAKDGLSPDESELLTLWRRIHKPDNREMVRAMLHTMIELESPVSGKRTGNNAIGES
jgi:transcriptional regulator with XRE-family HTH domain